MLLFSINGYFDYSFKSDLTLFVYFDGYITWKFGGPFRTRCKIDLELYPYDSQKCSIILSLWVSTRDLVYIDVGYANGFQYETNLWELTKYYAEKPTSFYGDSAAFSYIFQRKPLYYMVNIVLPLVLLLAISFGVFWLPAESGEKVSLGITVLLAASVFQLILSDNTPVSSDVTPRISLYFIFYNH